MKKKMNSKQMKHEMKEKAIIKKEKKMMNKMERMHKKK